MHGVTDVGKHRARTQVRQSQSHLAHRTCRTIPYMPSDISYFGDMLLSTFGFHRRVSRCPGGLCSQPPPSLREIFACTDTAHEEIPLVLRLGDSRGQNSAAKILENSDNIDWLRVRQQVLFNIPDIGTPILMSPHSLKRHF